MDINIGLPSGEQCKEDEDANGIDNMLDGDEKLHNGVVEAGSFAHVGEDLHAEDCGEMSCSAVDMVTFKEDTNLEPLSGMEFESHGEAYSFYQEYARSMGFNTAIQNSRRSKTSREFIDAKFACSRYGTKPILQDRYEEEAKANSDSWSKVPTLKSPSPFEKSVAGVYTHTVFKKFQVEVVGAIACSPKQENQEGTIFRVQDFEKNQDFLVTLNQTKSEVSCICRLYEYKGYLCRHALVVLQIKGHSTIPSQYILKRWTKEAKSRNFMGEESEQVQSRVQRYNDLFQRAIKLIEEASLSQESYYIAFRSLEEAFGNCLSANTSNKSLAEAVTSPTQGMICIEEDNQSRSTSKTVKKKNPTKKRKGNSEQEVMTVAATDGLQQMDKLNPRSVAIDSYFGAQPSVSGMVQLNLMAPRDNYYGNQQTIQGLGQLNTMPTSHDGYYGTQQSIPGLGMDFFRTPGFYIREDPNVRAAQLHDDQSRQG
ncbi:hypothetical protein CCACVL1_05058 [Corchorus capsularis]|uniref:Protein FAR1-RELATED SEQUENCE n=1 Tax=Corchorus capsularis TaxID=210143 RepID=A0A1R3JMR6_COCAP|nr:hypothetical protein CCACVL1_05058 [Corchorus capsularis]